MKENWESNSAIMQYNGILKNPIILNQKLNIVSCHWNTR